MSSLSILSLIAAGLIAAMTMAVSFRVLKQNKTLDNPIVAICVGLLTFIGLITMPGQWMSAVLILYAALGISIFLILLFSLFFGKAKDSSVKHDIQKARSRDSCARKVVSDQAQEELGTEDDDQTTTSVNEGNDV